MSLKKSFAKNASKMALLLMAASAMFGLSGCDDDERDCLRIGYPGSAGGVDVMASHYHWRLVTNETTGEQEYVASVELDPSRLDEGKDYYFDEPMAMELYISSSVNGGSDGIGLEVDNGTLRIGGNTQGKVNIDVDAPKETVTNDDGSTVTLIDEFFRAGEVPVITIEGSASKETSFHKNPGTTISIGGTINIGL